MKSPRRGCHSWHPLSSPRPGCRKVRNRCAASDETTRISRRIELGIYHHLSLIISLSLFFLSIPFNTLPLSHWSISTVYHLYNQQTIVKKWGFKQQIIEICMSKDFAMGIQALDQDLNQTWGFIHSSLGYRIPTGNSPGPWSSEETALFRENGTWSQWNTAIL